MDQTRFDSLVRTLRPLPAPDTHHPRSLALWLGPALCAAGSGCRHEQEAAAALPAERGHRLQ